MPLADIPSVLHPPLVLIGLLMVACVAVALVQYINDQFPGD